MELKKVLNDRKNDIEKTKEEKIACEGEISSKALVFRYKLLELR